MNTLGYFDLFLYPVTKEEIHLFHAADVSAEAIDIAVQKLIQDKLLFKVDEFYSLKNDGLLAERRRKGNLMAREQLKIARRVAKFLSRFPYVKCIAVSGSLSKNFATEKTDIDFFIITEANRLWIARTCMHLYKKFTFLTGRQNRYCMNYYVDEAALEIAEKNIFTAMEIVTLLPMQGKSSLADFNKGNSWVKKYFPLQNYSSKEIPEIRKGSLRKIIEYLFNGNMGNRLDNRLMSITQKRWQAKARKHIVNSRGCYIGMVIGQHFSKPDPKNFQQKVVEQYRIKVQQLLQLQNKTTTLVL